MSSHQETQVYRLNALDLNLAALRAQANALGQISTEHHGGIDVGSNDSVEYFVMRCADLVASLKDLLRKLPGMSDADRTSALLGFEKIAGAVQSEAEALIPMRTADADRHLEDCLKVEGVPVREWKDCAVVPDTASELKAKAHRHCHAAETGEIQAFVTQIKAVCELAMEALCVGGETAEEKARIPA